MFKTHPLNIKKKNYVINLTWIEFNNSKEIQKTTKLLQSNYGAKTNHSIGFCEKKYTTYYSLAQVVANKLKTGVFITDKLDIKDKASHGIEQTKLYWICFFDQKEPIVNIVINDSQRDISINTSGDNILNKKTLLTLLELYREKYDPDIYIDLDEGVDSELSSLGDEVFLEDLLASRIPSKFSIQKINIKDRNSTYIVLIVLLAMAYFGYNKYQQVSAVKEIQPLTVPVKKQVTSEYKLLKAMQKNNLYFILMSLDKKLQMLPVEMAGWTIQSLIFNEQDSDYIQVTYIAHDGQDIATVKKEALQLLEKTYQDNDQSIVFMNNAKKMQLKTRLPTISYNDLSMLDEKHIKEIVTTESRFNTISDIQHNYFDYRLQNSSHIFELYNKQDLSISNIDPRKFEVLLELSKRHINLFATVIKAQFTDGVATWTIDGGIYA